MEQIYNALIKENRWTWYLEGIAQTIIISIAAIAIGIVLGTIVSLIKYVNKKYEKLNVLSKICDAYLTVFRGTPVYVQLLIMYLIVLVMLPTPAVAIVTFGINSGAYVAEIIRGGLESVDDGQLEAGASLGLSTRQVMWHVVMPQGLRRALPSLFNEFIALVKETSIVGAIGVVDITKVAARIVARVYEPFVPYIVSALVYLVIVIALTKLLKLLERRLAVSDRHS
jgi:His/Glu/Gln/Arg/opine family amino acid ABC transporter permease subunit